MSETTGTGGPRLDCSETVYCRRHTARTHHTVRGSLLSAATVFSVKRTTVRIHTATAYCQETAYCRRLLHIKYCQRETTTTTTVGIHCCPSRNYCCCRAVCYIPDISQTTRASLSPAQTHQQTAAAPSATPTPVSRARTGGGYETHNPDQTNPRAPPAASHNKKNNTQKQRKHTHTKHGAAVHRATKTTTREGTSVERTGCARARDTQGAHGEDGGRCGWERGGVDGGVGAGRGRKRASEGGRGKKRDRHNTHIYIYTEDTYIHMQTHGTHIHTYANIPHGSTQREKSPST